jgi:hypothetical protein
VSGAGAWRVGEVGKHQLMRRTGLSARDLRALDPALSYPCSIMSRDRAVVVNLERARAVITATEVLVPGPRDPAVAPLVRNLRARLLLVSASPTPPQVSVRPSAPCPPCLFIVSSMDCLVLAETSLRLIFFLFFSTMEGGGRRCAAAEPRWSRWRRRQGRAIVCARQGPAVRVQGARGVPRVLMQVT